MIIVIEDSSSSSSSSNNNNILLQIFWFEVMVDSIHYPTEHAAVQSLGNGISTILSLHLVTPTHYFFTWLTNNVLSVMPHTSFGVNISHVSLILNIIQLIMTYKLTTL